MPASEGDDRWMWGSALTAPATRSLIVDLPDTLVIDAPTRLRIELQGYTNDPTVDGDHHIRVSLAGHRVVDVVLEGRGQHVLTAAPPPGLLQPDGNLLEVESVGDTGAAVDALFLNAVRLDVGVRPTPLAGRLVYPRPQEPQSHPGPDTDYAIHGFREASVTVLDVTDPSAPAVLDGLETVELDDGTWSVRYSDGAPVPGMGHGAVRRYVAFDIEAAASPARIEPNQASDWRAARHADGTIGGADWLAITHADFREQTEQLAAHRRRQGWRTAVVEVRDVYDEFGHGIYGPAAIRAFVEHAWRTWPRPAPRYLVLVGAATLDHRGGYGPPTRRFVPAPRVEVAPGGALATVTDDTWYAQISGADPVPELHVGRLPVASELEARTVVDKLMRYDANRVAAPEAVWRRRSLWVADDDGASAFEPFTEGLISRLPTSTETRRFFASGYDRERDLSADIATAIDSGALSINFTGHGNIDLWSPWPGGGRIFDNDDIARLSNGPRQPLLTAATCMNGFIDNPVKPISMSELWLTHPSGGGIAAWAPSGFTNLGPQRTLLETLYDGLFDGRGRTIGELTTTARAAAWAESRTAGDVIRQFVLVGDPATVISGVPVRPGPTPPTAANGIYLPRASGGTTP